MDPEFLTRLDSLMTQRTFGNPMFRRDFKNYHITIWVRDDLFYFMKFDRKTQVCHTTNYWTDKGNTTSYVWNYPARKPV